MWRLAFGLVLAWAQGEDTLSKRWRFEGLLSLQASQTALSNWQAGGQNQIGVANQIDASLRYQAVRTRLSLRLSSQYGVLRVVPQKQFRKTQDLLLLIFKYERAILPESRFFYIAALDGRTQWAPTYSYQGDEKVLPARSAFLAPFYGQFSVGLQRRFGEGIALSFYPLSGRMTYVRLQYLADAGAFGLKPALRDEQGTMLAPARLTYWEVGARFSSDIDLLVRKSLRLKHFLDVFGSYSSKTWGPVVLSQLQLAYKVKDWLALSISQQLIYDPRIASGSAALQLLTTWGLSFVWKS